jgi:hypothetical protein
MASYVNMVGTVALPMETRVIGSYVSDDLNDLGVSLADGFQVWIFAGEKTATSVGVGARVETSTDGVNWTILAGSDLPGVGPFEGNAVANAATDAPHVRVYTEVYGEDDGETLASMTYRVIVVAPAVAA